ncbi:MAG: autotransporter-associated beta strand repeat-containing protein, partial [Tepidisphaeraceae bacterium]
MFPRRGRRTRLSVANNNTNVTVQYSIIAESLNHDDHGFGSLIRPRINSNVTFHHNLYANNKSRNPRLGTYDEMTLTQEFCNNVIYNSSDRNGYAGGSSEAEQEHVQLNYVGNYVVAGPSSASNINKVFLIDKNVDVNAYQSGNFIDFDKQVNPGGTPNGADLGWGAWQKLATATDSNFVQEANPIAIPPAKATVTQSAIDAYWQVLNYVGNAWNDRSAVDARLVNNVKTNTGAVINDAAAITAEYDAILAAPTVTRPAGFDADNDGMSDAWESSHGGAVLSPTGDFDNDGYSNIEEYVNDLGAIPASRAIGWNGAASGRYALNGNWDTWQPSRFDTVNVNSGKAVIDAVGQHAGTLTIGQSSSAGEVEVTGGWLDVASAVDIGSAGGAGSGKLRLTGGSVAIGNALNLNTTGTVILGGGTLALNGAGTFNWNGGTVQTTVNQSIGLNATIGANGAKLDTTDKAVTYSGNLTGAGAFTKLGAGTATLTGTNSYAGQTNVNEGKLNFAKAGAASSSSRLNVGAAGSVTFAQQSGHWSTNADARYTMSDLAVTSGGVFDMKNNKLTLTASTLTENDLRLMKSDGRIVQTTGVANRAVGYTTSGANLVVAYAGIGDSNLDGQSDNADISALVLAGKYVANGAGATATWDEGDWNGDGKSSAGDISALILCGLYGSGAITSVVANAVSPGNSGDGVASIAYDIVTGSIKFAKDGDARDIREIKISSAGGHFVIANAENVGSFDVNSASLQDRFNLGAAFADGYDLGDLLASVPGGYDALSDLTIQYGVFGGGSLVAGDLVIVVPEPTSLSA